MGLASTSTHSMRPFLSLNYYLVLSEELEGLSSLLKRVIYSVIFCQAEGVDPTSTNATLNHEEGGSLSTREHLASGILDCKELGVAASFRPGSGSPDSAEMLRAQLPLTSSGPCESV